MEEVAMVIKLTLHTRISAIFLVYRSYLDKISITFTFIDMFYR